MCQLGVEEFSGFNLLDIDEEREREMIFEKYGNYSLLPKDNTSKTFTIFNFQVFYK